MHDKQTDVYEILMQFKVNKIEKNVYFVLWMDTTRVIEMQTFETELEIGSPGCLANYFLPSDIRKNPENYLLRGNQYCKIPKPCSNCFQTLLKTYCVTCAEKTSKSFKVTKQVQRRIANFELPNKYFKTDFDKKKIKCSQIYFKTYKCFALIHDNFLFPN